MVWVIASIVKIPTQPQVYITEMGCCVHALTRALPGGVKHPPAVFREYLKNGDAAHFILHHFYTCCENFRPWSLKVRSPGQVK